MPAISMPLPGRHKATDVPFAAESDRLGLGAHFRTCKRALGHTFALRCLAERIDEWLAPRLVTVMFGATALMVLAGGID